DGDLELVLADDARLEREDAEAIVESFARVRLVDADRRVAVSLLDLLARGGEDRVDLGAREEPAHERRAPGRERGLLALGAGAPGLDLVAAVDLEKAALHRQVQEGAPEVVHAREYPKRLPREQAEVERERFALTDRQRKGLRVGGQPAVDSSDLGSLG